jgi:putative transposase
MNSQSATAKPAEAGSRGLEGVDAVSFWRAYYYIVWATKNREALITPEIEPRLHAYIVNKAAELGLYIYALNGSTDHMHLVAAVPPKEAIAHVVKTLKGASSHDLNQQGVFDTLFAWQRGYGVLSLGSRQLADAVEYVRRQKDHHRDNTMIAWLERDADDDEGPEEANAIGKHPVPSAREKEATYDVLGQPPF